nr:hypothetical protein [Klebsiella pneumoniae]
MAGWLRQSPVKPNSRHMLEHIERLKAWQALDLPSGIERLVHQNRLLKIAREGGQMTPADGEVRAAAALRDHGGARHRGMAPSPTKSSTCMTASRASCSMPPEQASAAVRASGKAINAKVRLFGRIGGR